MKIPFRCVWLPALFLLATLSGCGTSAPVHFYALSGGIAGQEVADSEGPCFSLGVGPVDIPSYLDRSSIVTQEGPNQMHVADFDQWGEPLADGLTRVLMENLSDLLCIRPIASVPLPEGIRTDYQVAVQIRRFDGLLGGQAWLRATWSVLNAQGRLVSWKRSQLTQQVEGSGYGSLAAALSSLALGLSREIAVELKNIVQSDKEKHVEQE